MTWRPDNPTRGVVPTGTAPRVPSPARFDPQPYIQLWQDFPFS
jgi:hypothetical protein